MTYNIEVSPEVKIGNITRPVQRRVVVGGWLVGRVVIVRQQVEKVQMLVQRLDVKAFAGVFQRGWNGHCNHQSVLAGILSLGFEGCAHFL